jgi:hypothetical protein
MQKNFERKNETLNIKELWAKACEYDNIPADSKFVVFSNDNPYVADYNRAVGIMHRAIKPGCA